MLTVKAAAGKMGVSAALVYALCASRQLRHSRVGLGRGKIVISEEAVSEYLRVRESGPVEPEPPPERQRFRHPPLRHVHLPS
jgi:excisionase family DNA binding protein